MNKTIVCIRRGNDYNNYDYILRDGELFYNKTEKYFLVGDGEKSLNQLTPFSSLVAGENNIVYAVRIDKNGTPYVKPITLHHQGRLYEFRIDDSNRP